MALSNRHLQPLRYRGADASMVGAIEPTSPDPAVQAAWTTKQRDAHVADLLRWYNQTQPRSSGNDWVAQWLECLPKRKDLAQLARKHGDFSKVLGFMCRAAVMGLRLRVSELRRIHTALGEMLTQLEEKGQKSQARKPSIQDHINEKVRQCRGEIEADFDEFMAQGCAGDPNIMKLMIRFNIPQARVREIALGLQPQRQEFEQVLAGTDPYLVEAYSNFTRRQIRSCIRWFTQAQEQILSYGTFKSTTRKPRQSRPKSPERQVAGIKYQKQLEVPKLESIDPTLILRSSELWVYNVKRRKLGLYLVDDTQTAFSVKGTRLLGFSETRSVWKTIRKPEQQLVEFMKLGKPAARKWFSELKTAETPLGNRISADTLLLKAYK